jgi:pimeloyl-ACP methyl ester carboxylesterase
VFPVSFKKSGTGYPIILIHGFCESQEIWDEFAKELSKGFTVYAIDLPGFGKSPMINAPFSISDIAEVIWNWISSENIQKPILVGHSLGGYVTLAMCANHPKDFRAFSLFHSTAFADSDERKKNRDRVVEFVKAYGKDTFIDTYVPGLFFDKAHKAIPVVDAIARKTPLETLVNYSIAMRDRPSSLQVIKDFNSPILILGGENDGLIHKEPLIEMGNLSDLVEVKIIKGAAHMGMFENPEACLKAIRDFADSILNHA